ncbi:cysteine-rich CWC family protein [Limnohabitans sp. DCL3]|uniref:cysteine-rich CWC family protein n=1 Tax=Limnohabitans sp. DCL3 TaxID=3374103 RepID=UPI003A89E9E9
MTQSAFDSCHCPLCGQPNACAMARPLDAAPEAEPCWCTRVHFSADVLKQVPEAARNKACICAACVAASGHPTLGA